jgi:hypothetical protein
MTEEELREKIAELEHEQWSHWFKYMRDNGTMENIARWCVQAETDYQDLSEKEKDSDRKWADIVLTLIREAGYVPSHELQSIIDKAAESQNGQEVQEAQKDRSVLAKTVLHIKNKLVSEVNRGIWVENGFI